MKILFSIILSLSLCIALSSCTGSELGARGNVDGADKTQVFQVGDYPVWVTLPAGWEEDADPGSLDLQCISPTLDMYCNASGFSDLDLAEEQTTQDLFELQNDGLFSARENVTEIKPTTIVEDDEKITCSALYSAERNGAKNYYQLFFIRFKSTDDMVWIMFNGRPSVVEKNSETITVIIEAVQNSNPSKEF